MDLEDVSAFLVPAAAVAYNTSHRCHGAAVFFVETRGRPSDGSGGRQRQSVLREKKDVVRRYKAYQAKTRFQVSSDGKTLEFLEPRTEQGVLWLVGQLVGLWPERFQWLKIVDLDSHFGYDLLVLRKHHLMDAEEPVFVEMKYNLRDSADFNHSFDYLSSIVCWETSLHADEELRDIREHVRVFKIATPTNDRPFTKYFLNNPGGGLNIEVVVLRKYLEEVLALKRLN